MRISDWSSDVCSSDLSRRLEPAFLLQGVHVLERAELRGGVRLSERELDAARRYRRRICLPCPQSYAGLERRSGDAGPRGPGKPDRRSEEHTSELQSLMRISYAVFCLKKKNI